MSGFKKIYACLFILINFGSLLTSPLIIIYLKPIPKSAQIFNGNQPIKNQKTIDEKIAKISQKTPSGFSKNGLKNSLRNQEVPSLGGFLVTYGGYMEYSGLDGLITFPLKHSPATTVNLLISSDVHLIPIRNATFAFEEINSDDPNLSKIYSYNKHKDKKGFYYWNVREIPLPRTQQVSPIAIVIHTSPQNIFVQEGEFYSQEGTSIVLPENLYVLGNTMNIKLLIEFINKAAFYEPIKFKQESPKDTVLQSIIENN